MGDPEDEDFVKFEVSDWDMQFGAGNFKPKKMSKNQAIYGIWAGSESEEEDEDGKDDIKKKKKKHDYTSNINFVKSDQKLYEDDNDEKNDTQKESIPQTTSKKKNQFKKQPPQRFSGLGSSAGDADFGQWEMYTKGVGSKLLQKMGYQPGKGLGKNLQGIIEPIEAKKRPGAGSIGLYGPESTTRKPRKGDDKDEPQSIDKEDKESSVKDDGGNKEKNNWRKSGKPKAKTVIVYEKSAEDIIRESLDKSWNNNDKQSDLSGMKIIDMTGPEQRVLSGLTKLHQSKPQKPKSDCEITTFNSRFDIPELKQNILRLISLSEKNLVKRKREHDRNKNHIENLQEEKERLDQVLRIQREQLQNLDSLSMFIETLEELQNGDQKFTFEKALETFEKFLTDNLRTRLGSLKIDNLIMCLFNPVLRQELRSWRPFDNDSKNGNYYSLFERLKNLVFKTKTFDILMWDHWNPAVCRALQNWPTLKNYEPIVQFIEKWRILLPKWLFEYLVANSLIPRLKTEVEQWDPLTDTVSIHSWIHPWLPVLLVTDDNKELNFLFEPIYEIIRMKLSNALKSWHPSDCSARLILEPWKNVFNDTSMQSFLDVNIVPKLEQTIQSMVINPNQQSTNEWQWVIQWRTLISLNTIVSILERHFLPRWLNVLYVWLNSGAANYHEISSWYQGWKTLMGNELINHVTVKEFLKKALIMMDHSINLNNGLQSFTSYYNPSGPTHSPDGHQQNSFVAQQTVPSSSTIPINDQFNINNEKMSFRQMIEMKANECGILFMPLANRFENGHQIFKFGKYLIFIDDQVIFQQTFTNGQRTWQPIRIGNLVEMCNADR